MGYEKNLFFFNSFFDNQAYYKANELQIKKVIVTGSL